MTFVGPLRLRYRAFNRVIWGSSRIRMESSPSGKSKASKMACAVCSIRFTGIFRRLD